MRSSTCSTTCRFRGECTRSGSRRADSQGRPIPAGTYELKVTDSALRWEYVHWVGDTGEASPPARTAAINPFLAAFDDKGHLILGQGWSEEATNLRGYDAATGRWLWSVGGHSELHGLTLGGDGSIYALKPSGTQGLITRVDPQTGKVLPWSALGSTAQFRRRCRRQWIGGARRPALRDGHADQHDPPGNNWQPAFQHPGEHPGSSESFGRFLDQVAVDARRQGSCDRIDA